MKTNWKIHDTFADLERLDQRGYEITIEATTEQGPRGPQRIVYTITATREVDG